MEQEALLDLNLKLLKIDIDSASLEFTKIRNQLISIVKELIYNDFQKLLVILYRIDVDEKKLKFALFDSSLPAAETIVDLIIERQFQKLKYRELFRQSQS